MGRSAHKRECRQEKPRKKTQYGGNAGKKTAVRTECNNRIYSMNVLDFRSRGLLINILRNPEKAIHTHTLGVSCKNHSKHHTAILCVCAYA